jgi:hypothetical protein
VITEPTQLHSHQDQHLEALKTQIARCLERETNLQAEERRVNSGSIGRSPNDAQFADEAVAGSVCS